MVTGLIALVKSIFLRFRFLSNARWFYGKKYKIWKGNQNWKLMKYTQNVDNQNFMCYICAKEFSASNFNLKAVIDKISIFHKIAQNFSYSQKL